MSFSNPPSAASHHHSRIPAGIALGLAASLAFATSGTFVRPLLEVGWTPGAAVFWRVLVASVLLAPFGLWVMRGHWAQLRTEWFRVLAFGLLAVAMAQGMYFAAVSRMSVSVALLLEYMAPVALVLLAWVRTRRSPSGLILGGSAASVVGLFCVLDLTGARLDGLGVLFAMGAMVGAAAYFVIGAGDSRLPTLALPAFGLPIGAFALGLLIAVGALPYSAPLVDVTLLGQLVPWWVPLSVVIVVATAAAYALGLAGLPLMGERLSSFVSLSEVLFATAVAALILGEIPTPMQLLGGVGIIAGVVLIRLDGMTTTPAPAEELVALD